MGSQKDMLRGSWSLASCFNSKTNLCATSQIRRLLSSETERRYLPPGWNARPRTQLSCPRSVARHSPVDASQMRMVWKLRLHCIEIDMVLKLGLVNYFFCTPDSNSNSCCDSITPKEISHWLNLPNLEQYIRPDRFARTHTEVQGDPGGRIPWLG